MNTGPKWRTVGAVWLFVLVAWLAVLAQDLGDAEYRNLTVTTAMTANDGTDRDWYISFDHGGQTATFGWDDSAASVAVKDGAFRMEKAAPVTMDFYDTTSSASTTTAAFQVTDTGNDGEFAFTMMNNDLPVGIAPFKMTWSTNDNPILKWTKTGEVYAGYTGTSGSGYFFFESSTANGYYFSNGLYIDANSPRGVILKDSGGSCFQCSLASAAAYTVTNVTTDRSYDADSTSIDEIADVLGTLIADLDTINHVGTSTDNVLVCTSTTCPTVNP